jgi:hypothetical protein
MAMGYGSGMAGSDVLHRAVEVHVIEGVDRNGRITDDPVEMVEGTLGLTLDNGTHTTITFERATGNPRGRLASC